MRRTAGEGGSGVGPDFQGGALSVRSPVFRLNGDATRMSQAFTGIGQIQRIVADEVNDFMQGHRAAATPQVDPVVWPRFFSLTPIGASLSPLSRARFRKTLATMA
jgi:hypothetical protein